jgi:hypothetical protein
VKSVVRVLRSERIDQTSYSEISIAAVSDDGKKRESEECCEGAEE